ncbi:MAG: helix-turn-helix domain-containing protein [Acetobacter papayae]
MDSNSSSKKRAPVQPSRAAGRQRVSDILAAASELMAERGYEATTMAEIALRAGAKIGSLYRFFPNKEAVGDALLQQNITVLNDEYSALAQKASELSLEDLADVLLDFLTVHYPRVKSLSALMEARTDRLEIRSRSRQQALNGIATALTIAAPRLDNDTAKDIAAVTLNLMKVMRAMTTKDAPTTAGATAELRRMNRLYLLDRLTPYQK